MCAIGRSVGLMSESNDRRSALLKHLGQFVVPTNAARSSEQSGAGTK